MTPSNPLMQSIAENWQLDARFEATDKYFYHYKEVEMILNNRKCYVIGRKGSGKSAICTYVEKLVDHSLFSVKLSFKNFPFNFLYSLPNHLYTSPNQYITIWKYLIYSHVCKLMVTNMNINESVRTELEHLYPKNDMKLLSRKISEWTSREFGASILGCGGSIKVSRQVESNDLSWMEKVDVLEDIIQQYCDNSKYYIVFDELDEDYREVQKSGESELYTYLLTSLFKAVQDVKMTFSQTKPNIMPIVFLRDDIYSNINDSDKNKWSDWKIDLDWNPDKIKALLAYRISRDLNYQGSSPNFEIAWNKLFSACNVHYGDRQSKEMNPFDFITRSTQLRPRDYILYIKRCCEHSLERGEKLISEDTIKFVDRAFSNYLKDEIKDEVFPILPDIENIFQIISNVHKQVFSAGEFEAEYNKYLNKNTVKEANVDFVLDVLFNFSVIGNEDKFKIGRHYFKYQHTNMTFNKDEKIVIHRGLFKALQIL